MRELFVKEWLPYALAIGIRETEFWHMTMRTLNAHIRGNELRRKMHDYEMWLMGGYVIEAIMSSIGNSQWFRGKHGKIHHYPQKPMLEQAMENSGPMSERELQRQRELFVARLQVMKTNFELSKRKNRDDRAS